MHDKTTFLGSFNHSCVTPRFTPFHPCGCSDAELLGFPWLVVVGRQREKSQQVASWSCLMFIPMFIQL